MTIDAQMLWWVYVWLLVGSILLFGQFRLAVGTGLVAAYTLQMFMLHWLAAAIYVLPWYWYLNPAVVFSGLEKSTYAMAGFTTGAVGVSWWAFSQRRVYERTATVMADSRNLKAYTIVGVAAYFVLMPLFGGIPTVSAIISAATGCVVMALAMVCWNAAHGPKPHQMWWWLVLASAMPFVTIAVQGFMGYGLAATVIIFMFVASFYRPRWRTLVVGLVSLYVGLSLYVTYMRDRREIREVVWGGESASARLVRLSDTFFSLEPFNIYNIDHLRRIDWRLNQNYLVGSAVLNLDVRPELFANGETIWQAMIAPIPRALWPDKPVAGSGNLVSRFTGMQFAEGTSVGIGQVMELYVNFGDRGVFLGFILIGGLLSYIDRKAAEHRNHGDWPGFAIWFLPGLSMLQLGGSLIEVTSGASAALVVALLLKRFGPKAVAIRPAPRTVIRTFPRPARQRL